MADAVVKCLLHDPEEDELLFQIDACLFALQGEPGGEYTGFLDKAKLELY